MCAQFAQMCGLISFYEIEKTFAALFVCWPPNGMYSIGLVCIVHNNEANNLGIIMMGRVRV